MSITSTDVILSILDEDTTSSETEEPINLVDSVTVSTEGTVEIVTSGTTVMSFNVLESRDASGQVSLEFTAAKADETKDTQKKPIDILAWSWGASQSVELYATTDGSPEVGGKDVFVHISAIERAGIVMSYVHRIDALIDLDEFVFSGSGSDTVGLDSIDLVEEIIDGQSVFELTLVPDDGGAARVTTLALGEDDPGILSNSDILSLFNNYDLTPV